MNRDPRSLYDEILRELEAMPAHDAAAVEAAARHLEMLHYQVLVDFTSRDFLRLSNREFIAELDAVMKMDGDSLRASATVVEEWTGDAKKSPEENRAKRMEFMFKEYRKLCRLRGNEPEAWDEINELYYDD